MPASKAYSASASGKLILLGEHAVLHGHPAIVCAVNQSIHVHLTPRADREIYIDSALGKYHTTLDQLSIEKPFAFILAALKQYQPHLPSGVNIRVISEFSEQIGFGSSAAVTVATLQALQQWLTQPLSPLELFHQAKTIVQTAQNGVGSGLDLVAAIWKGTTYFDPATLTIVPLTYNPPLTVVYCGYKTPTPEVIRHVEAGFSKDQATLADLCQQMGELSRQAKITIEKADWPTLGTLLTKGQSLMNQLGVNDATLQNIVDTLNQTPGIYGAKISGSGLGDCVVGIGQGRVTFDAPISVLNVSVA